MFSSYMPVVLQNLIIEYVPAVSLDVRRNVITEMNTIFGVKKDFFDNFIMEDTTEGGYATVVTFYRQMRQGRVRHFKNDDAKDYLSGLGYDVELERAPTTVGTYDWGTDDEEDEEDETSDDSEYEMTEHEQDTEAMVKAYYSGYHKTMDI